MRPRGRPPRGNGSEPDPLLPAEDFSAFGLRLRLVAAVALFNVDMLGFPEDPCFGECVPKGDLGLLDAVLLLLLCFGLL